MSCLYTYSDTLSSSYDLLFYGLLSSPSLEVLKPIVMEVFPDFFFSVKSDVYTAKSCITSQLNLLVYAMQTKCSMCNCTSPEIIAISLLIAVESVAKVRPHRIMYKNKEQIGTHATQTPLFG